MKPAPKNPFTRTLSIEASKDGEGHDASGTVHFPDGTYTQYLAETMAECLKLIRQDLAALQLPMPDDDDITIEEERGGYQHAYWELNFMDDAPVAAFVEQFCKDRRPNPPSEDPTTLILTGFIGFLIGVALAVAFFWARSLW